MEMEILTVMVIMTIGFGLMAYLLAFRLDELNSELRLLKKEFEFLEKKMNHRDTESTE